MPAFERLTAAIESLENTLHEPIVPVEDADGNIIAARREVPQRFPPQPGTTV